MPHILPISFLDFLIISTIIGCLFAWRLSDSDEIVDKTPNQKITCDIEDYSELQRRINKIQNRLEDLERPDLSPCEYEPSDEDLTN